MATVTLFKNTHGSVNVVRKGKVFPFNSGRFWTSNKEDQELLKKIAEAGEQGVYIDPQEPDIDPTAASPMEVLRRKIIKEWQEQQAQVHDHGEYGAGKNQLGVSSTADSILMGNSLAAKVDQAKTAGEDVPVVSATPATPADSPALSALQQLKSGEKK